MRKADQLMKVKEWSDAVYYRVGCDCACPEHDLSIWAQSLGEVTCYELRMEATLEARAWRSRGWPRWLSWLEGPYNRVAIAARVLATGRVAADHEFVLGPENVRGLRTALQDIERKLG